MSMMDKVSRKLQDLLGKGKQGIGSATGNSRLETDGKGDQVKAAVKDAGEHVKEAASHIKDALKGD
jgi:uncharacterized protein YjbJ (UPF0337 family)